MNIDLSDEAVEYGRLARRALGDAGGDELVQRAEAQPDAREGLVAPVLAHLGAWDLDPRASSDELEAAAALCRSAGWWASPYPVAERLARPSDPALAADGLVVVAQAAPDGDAGVAGDRAAGAAPRPAAVRGVGAGLHADGGAGSDGAPRGARPAPAGPLGSLGHRRWLAIALDGRRSWATPRPSVAPPRKTAFVTDLQLRPLDGGSGGEAVDVAGRAHAADAQEPGGPGGGAGRDEAAQNGGPADGGGVGDAALGLVLPCWTLLGMLDRAVALTRDHVREREQFGQPLASFQGVQFQLTDAEVERAGVEELARYALWSLHARPGEAVADALALRLAAIEAADVVFRVAHQLHGAIGFCDEATLSWLSRYSQPLRRLPLGLSATRHRLTHEIGRWGLSGLFDALAPAPETADRAGTEAGW